MLFIFLVRVTDYLNSNYINIVGEAFTKSTYPPGIMEYNFSNSNLTNVPFFCLIQMWQTKCYRFKCKMKTSTFYLGRSEYIPI